MLIRLLNFLLRPFNRHLRKEEEHIWTKIRRIGDLHVGMQLGVENHIFHPNAMKGTFYKNLYVGYIDSIDYVHRNVKIRFKHHNKGNFKRKTSFFRILNEWKVYRRRTFYRFERCS